jgi:hypothetical protein
LKTRVNSLFEFFGLAKLAILDFIRKFSSLGEVIGSTSDSRAAKAALEALLKMKIRY